MAPRRIRRQLVSQRSVQNGGMALSRALEIFSDRAARDLCEDRAQELGREPPTRIGRCNWIQLPALSDSRTGHVGYSWMRCLSSQTRNAASKSAFVRVSVPAAAMVVPISYAVFCLKKKNASDVYSHSLVMLISSYPSSICMA